MENKCNTTEKVISILVLGFKAGDELIFTTIDGEKKIIVTPEMEKEPLSSLAGAINELAEQAKLTAESLKKLSLEYERLKDVPKDIMNHHPFAKFIGKPKFK